MTLNVAGIAALRAPVLQSVTDPAGDESGSDAAGRELLDAFHREEDAGLRAGGDNLGRKLGETAVRIGEIVHGSLDTVRNWGNSLLHSEAAVVRSVLGDDAGQVADAAADAIGAMDARNGQRLQNADREVGASIGEAAHALAGWIGDLGAPGQFFGAALDSYANVILSDARGDAPTPLIVATVGPETKDNELRHNTALAMIYAGANTLRVNAAGLDAQTLAAEIFDAKRSFAGSGETPDVMVDVSERQEVASAAAQARLEAPQLTPQDYEAIRNAVRGGADSIAVAVDDAQDVLDLRSFLGDIPRARGVRIVAEVGTRKGLENISAIVPISAAVIANRGDLITAVGPLNLLEAQRAIASAAAAADHTPVILTDVATSMTHQLQPVPKPAETIDLARAAQAALGVMLEEQTSHGANPVGAVQITRDIAAQAVRDAGGGYAGFDAHPADPADGPTVIPYLGPATRGREGALIAAGFPTLFVDSSSFDPRATLNRNWLDSQSREANLLLNIGGPAVRVGELAQQSQLRDGDALVFDTSWEDTKPATSTTSPYGITTVTAAVPGNPQLAKELHAGDELLLDNGRIKLDVSHVAGPEIHTTVTEGGVVNGWEEITRANGSQVSTRAMMTQQDVEFLDSVSGFAYGDSIVMSVPNFYRMVDRDIALKDRARNMMEDWSRALQRTWNDNFSGKFKPTKQRLRHFPTPGEAIDTQGGNWLTGGWFANKPLVANVGSREALAQLHDVVEQYDEVLISRNDLQRAVSAPHLLRTVSETLAAAKARNKRVRLQGDVLGTLMASGEASPADLTDAGYLREAGFDGIVLSQQTAAAKHLDPVAAAQLARDIMLSPPPQRWK